MTTPGSSRWTGFLLFFVRWAITAIAVLVASHVVRGIHYDSYGGLFVAALLLGIFNAFLRPVLMLLSLPLLVLTLGLFTLFINALMLYWVGHLAKDFYVDTFGAAFWGALIISLVSMVLNALAGTGGRAGRAQRRPPPRKSNPPDTGSGPVIDV